MIPKFLLPSLIGVSVYIIVDKIFPEGGKRVQNNPSSSIKIRGGSKSEIVRRIVQKILKDRALKIALLSIFATAGYTHFQSEIEMLLTDNAFKYICVRDADGKLRIVCDIIKDHELDSHSQTLGKLIASNNLGKEEKISLLKIKLDYIINGDCFGKKRFFLVSIIAALITVSISGVGGLALFLEALYRLFQEGKISRALYNQIVKALARRWGWSKIPNRSSSISLFDLFHELKDQGFIQEQFQLVYQDNTLKKVTQLTLQSFISLRYIQFYELLD